MSSATEWYGSCGGFLEWPGWLVASDGELEGG